MKIKILFIAFLFLGTIYSQAQPPSTSSQEIKETPVPEPVDDCVELIDFTNTCDENGNVELSFFIFNNTNTTITSFVIQASNGLTIINVGDINIPPFSTYPEPIIIVLEDDPELYPEEGFCFHVRLYNDEVGLCCHREFCTDIEACECGFIEDETIVCDPENLGEYDYCFTVINPAYATSVVNQVVFFPLDDNICINGNPPPYPVLISPALEPGNSTNVCVTVEACDGTLPSGTDIDFVVFLEDFMSDYCCHLTTSITTPSCCELIAEVVPKPSNCDIADGSVTITTFGGTPPYLITGFGPAISSNGGTVLIENLATGIYDYTITDANGCEIMGTVEIGEIPCECDNINDHLEGGVGITNQLYTSNGDGFLCISFITAAQPDQLQIVINGTQVVDSGLYSSDLTQSEASSMFPNCGGIIGGAQTSGVPQPFVASIPITQGQVIDLSILGATCPGNDNSVWSLDIYCQSTPCNVIPNLGNNTIEEESIKTEKKNHKRLGQINEGSSINLYPNPSTNWLNIKVNNNIEEQATFRILNITGSLMADYTKDVYPNSDVRLNVEDLPNGIYFLEVRSSNGQLKTQKFIIKK